MFEPQLLVAIGLPGVTDKEGIENWATWIHPESS